MNDYKVNIPRVRTIKVMLEPANHGGNNHCQRQDPGDCTNASDNFPARGFRINISVSNGGFLYKTRSSTLGRLPSSLLAKPKRWE